MATQRYISTSFWDDPWIRTLSPDERYLYLYFLTSPLSNIAGVYQISLDRICFDVDFDSAKVKLIVKKFQTAGKAYFFKGKYIILPSWPKHQKWQTKKKIETGIVTILKGLPPETLGFLKKIGYTYPVDSLSIPYTYQPNYSDLDSDIDIDTNTDINSDSSKDETSSKKDKEKPIALLSREPKNDMERVNKKWLENYIKLFESQPINPRWDISAPLVSSALKQVGVEKILQALDTAMNDEFCINAGYMLKVIMSGNVISKLINKPAASGPGKLAERKSLGGLEV